MNKIVPVLCLSILSGCAQLEQFANRKPPVSYVMPGITIPDADQITKDMANFLAAQLPAAKTTIAVERLPSMFHGMLLDELVIKGFGIVETNPGPDQQVVALRYIVTPLDDGLVIRMRYGDKIAGRYYGRQAGKLSLGNKYAVREATK